MLLKNLYSILVGLALSASSYSQTIDLEMGGAKKDSAFLSQEEALIATGMQKYDTKENELILNSSEKTQQEARRVFGDNYGGIWVDYLENGLVQLVVGYSGIAGVNQKIALESLSGVKVLNVKYSLNELELMQKKILEIFSGKKINGFPAIYGAALIQQKNNILIRAEEDNLVKVKEILWNEGFDFEVLDFEKQSGPATFTGIVHGGTKILAAESSQSTSAMTCTTGFNVIVDNVYPASVTAAHCYEGNKWKNVYFNLGTSPTGSILGDQIGEFFASGWAKKDDAIIFGNTNFVHTEAGTMLTTGQASIVKVKELELMRENQMVCTHGSSSGWRCGRTVAISSPQYVDGEFWYFVEVDICGKGGDSGGPVVSQKHNAQGIYSGTIGKFPNGTCGTAFGGQVRPNSIVQPLDRYLAKYPNVKLRID
ncbi:S1 family peptidase [Paracidovorax konjaci]|uniref:Trypsin n=1 Tax=Paracidovorax konjaci TaxID=32040 RepID=A0A1I1U7G6_9BURK|nr:S1 family peptidase [Paracidovorax konjaci]SFD66772.1 hypothetical protein SAMN04489710_104388 [Paracidovorax konjaci]